jgi:hypothetical protein
MANLPNTVSSTSPEIFFNGYFSQPLQVSDAVWGQVYGYFLTVTNDAASASALAQAIIALTYNNNLNPLTVISQFQAAPNSSNVKQLLISFFNSAKGPTSKLGYTRNNTVSPNVSRNIIP